MDAIWEGRNQKSGERTEQSNGWAEHQTVSVAPVVAQHLSTYPAGDTQKDTLTRAWVTGCLHGMS